MNPMFLSTKEKSSLAFWGICSCPCSCPRRLSKTFSGNCPRCSNFFKIVFSHGQSIWKFVIFSEKLQSQATLQEKLVNAQKVVYVTKTHCKLKSVCYDEYLEQLPHGVVVLLQVQPCKLCNNKYRIASTQITNTEIFAFIAVPVYKLLSGKVLFINRKDNRNC